LAFVARRVLVILGVLALCMRVAAADPPGAETLTRGIRALEKGDYAQAAKLFDNALTRGGLARVQTLTAYVNLGASLVALGNIKGAERAFEQAALIDPSFAVPPRSGRQAIGLADQAKHKQEAIGQYHLEVGAPGDVKAGEPFHVTVELDEAQVALVALVRVSAKEPGGKHYETVEPSAAKIAVDIPAEVAVAGATIDARFELMDQHANRLATVEKDIAVSGEAASPVVKPEPVGSAAPVATGSATKPEGDDDDSGGAASEAESGPWSIPHGSKQYVPARAEQAPKIDGVLTDAIWATAPKDDRFLSTKSKPYGKPTTEPTVVQVSYDDKNIYVAFRCTYGKPHAPSDAFIADEQTLLDESEYVAVVIDAVHGHTGGYEFAVTPAGARADAEISDQGAAQNLDWHGLWDADTTIEADGWTAEIAIPWGTMHMSGHDEPFDIGIEFERRVPDSGEEALWTLHPPATELFDTNFFGHAEGLANVHPGQRLLFIPYIAGAFDSSPPTAQSRLTDLTGTDAQGRIYAGAYLRLQPPGPFRLDATINPDFSAVNPDRATADFDRFELEYPEARAFFAEDSPRFSFGGARYQFGDLGAQLFYSRRLGIITDKSGFTTIVPILWGVKSVLRDGGTEAAIMNVETVQPQSGVVLDDNATVGRITQTIDGQRIGAIVLACGSCALDANGNAIGYESGGIDGALSLYDRHLSLSGFYSASRLDDGTVGSAGEGTGQWKSQDFYAKATLLAVGKEFQAPLGFFETTGVLDETVAAGYTPVVRADHVQQVFIETQLSNVRDSTTDALVYRRAVISGSLQTIDNAELGVAVGPAEENVTTAFPIGTHINVPIGLYHPVVTSFQLLSPPNRDFVFGLNYLGGDLFDGTRRAPGAMLGVNLGRFTARFNYTFYLLKFADQTPQVTFYGHDIALTASFAYTPLARTAVVLELDTVASRASALVTTSYQFGTLSALTFSVRGSSGSTYNTPETDTFAAGDLSAILAFQLGLSPI
jgi:Domain of unknown function (DUF5916)